MGEKHKNRILKVAGVARKASVYITMDFWLEMKELLPKESEYKNSYPCSLEDKAKFIMQLVK